MVEQSRSGLRKKRRVANRLPDRYTGYCEKSGFSRHLQGRAVFRPRSPDDTVRRKNLIS